MAISGRYIVGSTLAFLLVGLVALLSIVGTTLWLNERAQVNFDRAIEARDTRGATVELRTALQTAESAQRGFLVSGNEIYLAPYDAAKSQAQRKLAAITQLLAAYRQSDLALERLTQLTGDKIAEMDEIITLKRARQDEEALALFRTNRGKALMDEASLFLSAIIRQADDRLTEGVDEQRVNTNLVRTVSAIGALVIVAVIGGAAIGISRYTYELKMARDEVNGLNADLEQRVSERTADLEQARDKAEVLLSEVNHRVANSLALVSSLVTLQAKAIGDPAAKQALAETQERIFAISLVHKRLYGSNDVRVVMLDEYLAALLDHLKASMQGEGQVATLIYDLERVVLPTDAGINLGVVVTEWVTNAFKYAYPDGAGEIRVALRALSNAQIELVVEDDGVGRAEDAPAKGTGLGTRIVTAMAANMKAKIDYRQRQPGTAARLLFSAKAA
ncbi:MAG: CHASE3 domain-containing protein [Devosia sp.]